MTRHTLPCNFLGTVPSVLQVVMLVVCASQRLDGGGVDPRGRHADQFAFWIAHGGQAASMDTAGIDIDRISDPHASATGRCPQTTNASPL